MSRVLPGPKSKEYLERAKKFFAGWGRPEALEEALAFSPFIVKETRNALFIDVDGYEYIDFMSGWASNNVGNVHPEVLEAVVEALKEVGFCYNHYLAVELAEKLAEVTPKNLTRVRYEVSGTEAAEGAVSFALAYTKRPAIISFIGQFHGDSIGARLLGSVTPDRKRYCEALYGSGVLFAPYPVSFNIPGGMSYEEYGEFCLDFIERQILKNILTPDRIAGVLLEPMMAEGGNWIPPANFIRGLRKMCDEYGWVLIDDEVLTGVGRTGKMWGIEHYGVDVDILVTAKGLTGGLIPIGAVVGSEEVMGETSAYSGSTFAGCPAGCAAAIKTFEIIERDRLLERAARLGEKALKRMKEWVDDYKLVGDARGVGLLLAITIVDKDGKESKKLAREVYVEATRQGVRAIWDDEPHIRIYPPLTISEELFDRGLTMIENAVKIVERSTVA